MKTAPNGVGASLRCGRTRGCQLGACAVLGRLVPPKPSQSRRPCGMADRGPSGRVARLPRRVACRKRQGRRWRWPWGPDAPLGVRPPEGSGLPAYGACGHRHGSERVTAAAHRLGQGGGGSRWGRGGLAWACCTPACQSEARQQGANARLAPWHEGQAHRQSRASYDASLPWLSASCFGVRPWHADATVRLGRRGEGQARMLRVGCRAHVIVGGGGVCPGLLRGGKARLAYGGEAI
jgi:hypothetical protein